MFLNKKRTEGGLLEFFITGPISHLFVRIQGSLATVTVWMLLPQNSIRRLVRRSRRCPRGRNKAIRQMVRSLYWFFPTLNHRMVGVSRDL